MGQGIISRSNPGNSGDKVGDIRITTRNTLGEKWALCNGSHYTGECAIPKDPLNDSCWKDLDIDFNSSEFKDSITDYNSLPFNSGSSFKEIIPGNKCWYLIYEKDESDSHGYGCLEIFIVEIYFDEYGNLKIGDNPDWTFGITDSQSYDASNISYSISIDDNHMCNLAIFKYREGDYQIECAQYALNAQCNLMNYDSKNLPVDTTSYDYCSFIGKTKSRSFFYANGSGDVAGYLYMFHNGTISPVIAQGGSRLWYNIGVDYLADFSCISYQSDNSPDGGFTILYYNNEVMQEAVGPASYAYIDLATVIYPYIIYKDNINYSGYIVYNIETKDTYTIDLGTYYGNQLTELYVFFDIGNILILTCIVTGEDTLTGESCNKYFVLKLQGDMATLDQNIVFDSFTEFDTVYHLSGNFTNVPFYFRARGTNELCMPKIPEISVDDESYCFIKIKD